MLVALSSMARNTGSSSPGVLEMTCRTSEVAVCCCSEFAQLVEQARVLDGDDGLAGEIGDQFYLPVSEGANLKAVDANDADQLILLEHRH